MHSSAFAFLRAALLSAMVAVLLQGCTAPASKEPLDRCAGVVCAASDGCHLAGVCDGNTGVCTNPLKGTAPTVGTLSIPAGPVLIGEPVQIDLPSVSLGCGPALPSEVSYAWSIVDRPAGSAAQLTSTTAPAPAFVPDVAGGHYLLSLTVADALGNTAAPEFLSIDVAMCGGSSPIVTSLTAPSTRPAVGSTVTISASAWDADTVPAPAGVCVAPQPAWFEYQWRLVSAPAGSAVSGSNGFVSEATHTFVADLAGSYEWEATARDATGRVSTPASIAVPTGACAPSLAFPGIASPAFLGWATVGEVAGAVLNVPINDVCVRDPVYTITFSIVDRPAGSTALIDPAAGTFVPDRPGSYSVQVVVTDQGGFAMSSVATLVVSPCSSQPLLSAIATEFWEPSGPPLFILYQGGRVELAVGVTPASCGQLPPSTVYAYEWVMVSRPRGSSATLLWPTTARPSFIADVAGGVYQVAVAVTDEFGNRSVPGQRSLSVSDCGSERPVASITGDASVDTYGSLSLTGTAAMPSSVSACPARLQSSVERLDWALQSAPLNGSALWSAQTGTLVDFSPQHPSGGVPYVVALTATSTNGVASLPVLHTVIASDCGAQAPAPIDGGSPAFIATQVVNGTAFTSTSTSPVMLNQRFPVGVTANVVDPDVVGTCGLPNQGLFLSWRLAGAPVGSLAELGRTDTLTTLFTPDLAGIYTLELMASDSTGATSFTSFAVTVRSCGGNAPLVQSVSSSPASPTVGTPVALAAVTTDVDTAFECALTDPTTLRWSFIAMPSGSAAPLLGPEMAAPSFVPDRAGTYVVSVVATDSTGLQGAGTVTVTVSP
jgi:hypothetical protein